MLARTLAVLCFMVIQVGLIGQVITINDQISGQPILANIACLSSGTVLSTDASGKADVSSISTCEHLHIWGYGYDTIVISTHQLEEYKYNVNLIGNANILKEVTVSTYQYDAINKTSIHIEPLSVDQLDQTGAFGLSDGLATIPGVAQLSTGIGISKPVIRGLYGNRILVLLSGLRFDNQQWQDEHGLGLSDLGISKLELIKGPLSLLYGTEAIGGVINIIEERPPTVGFSESEIKSNFHSNTLGGGINFGYRANYGKYWIRLRGGYTNHCDYSDGNNQRVLNSRFNSQNMKISLGFQKNKWTSENHYFFSNSRFGFIFSDISHFMDPDARWSRSMAGPHHIVLLNTFSSVNRITLRNSILKLHAGAQSNYRAEDEGGGELSLKMLLLTGQYALKWEKYFNPKLLFVLANNSSIENNTNYGKRKIVPDAKTIESSISGYLKYTHKKVILEYGIGGGYRHITTLLTPTVNTSEKEIDPFSQDRTFVNTMGGVSLLPAKNWNVKINGSTGVRAPNLAELSSNGLHEGIYTYEIGDPSMKNERNINLDLGIYHTGDVIGFSLSGFYNYFFNYIYLQPTEEEWYGFPIHKFVQYNARIYGGEGTAYFQPIQLDGLKISASYAMLVGQLDNGDYLPYMPANKLTSEVRYTRSKKQSQWYVFSNVNLVMSQTLTNPYEWSTPQYLLWNGGVGISWDKRHAQYSFNLIGNNLLNEAYYDHLSRFKNFGLLNIGRDISLQLKIKFKNQLKKEI